MISSRWFRDSAESKPHGLGARRDLPCEHQVEAAKDDAGAMAEDIQANAVLQSLLHRLAGRVPIVYVLAVPPSSVIFRL